MIEKIGIKKKILKQIYEKWYVAERVFVYFKPMHSHAGAWEREKLQAVFVPLQTAIKS